MPEIERRKMGSAKRTQARRGCARNQRLQAPATRATQKDQKGNAMTNKLKMRKAKPKAQLQPEAEVILNRVKIKNFSQCRAVASRLLRALVNGQLDPQRAKYAVSLLNVVVSCNQNIQIKARLQKIQEALHLPMGDIPDVPEETETPEADDAPVEAGEEADEPEADDELDDDPDRDAKI
jgi:hypothetical protein